MDCVHSQRGSRGARKGDKGTEKDKQPLEVLPVTKLRFSREQLRALNYHLTKKLTPDELNAEPGISVAQAESIVERLTQRLICAVGNLDPRFSSKFLVTLHDTKCKMGRTNLEYLVRLDTLSTPVLYPKDVAPSCEILEHDEKGTSPGYARLRLRNKTSTKFAEFINASGYLRRDKIQERFVELLALAAAGGWPVSPLDVDESTLCAAPGKVLDAATLHQVLRLPPEERVFYGAAANNMRFPDPRDFRLAIVDESTGVRLRVGFLSPSLAGHDVEVRLLLAVGVDAWPRSTTYPSRIPLGHAECLLYQRTADTGMYLVANGVQSASWQILLPAAEVTLLNHYGPSSSVSLVLKILYAILDEIHSRVTEDKCKFSYKLLNRRLMREALWKTLEEDCSSPLSAMLDWTSGNTSKHTLRLLDKLIGALRCQSHPSYFFPRANLLANPGYITEEDYLVEANRFFMFLVHLCDESLRPIINDDTFTRMCAYEDLDESLVSRWSDVVTGLMPPAATRSSRFSFAAGRSGTRRQREAAVAYTQYTGRQLEYIGLLLKSMLDVKQNTVQFSNGVIELDRLSLPEDPIEDVIYLLVTIIEQARDHAFPSPPPLAPKPKYRTKTRSHFDTATAKLVEAVRRDRKRNSTSSLEVDGDVALVQAVLRWLYKGLDHSRHSLAPVLRPYLHQLFIASHAAAWHLEALRNREAASEKAALGVFSRLVGTGVFSPAAGLIESVNKGWDWARNMLQLVQRSRLRVLFIPERGKVFRHILSLPSYERTCDETRSERGTLHDPRMGLNYPRKNATLPARAFQTRKGDISSRALRSESVILHEELKRVSPMTETLRMTHRFGVHRCYGNLLQSLVALHKIPILQELAHLLPPTDRQELLDTIQKLSRENKRQAALRRRSTLPPMPIHSAPKTLGRRTQTGTRTRKYSIPQTYTPTHQTAGLLMTTAAKVTKKDELPTEIAVTPPEMTLVDPGTTLRQQRVLQEREKALSRKLNTDTLIGSCRAARIKEDSRVIFHENFKIKALFKPENAT